VRALILVLSAAVVALATLILLHRPGPPEEGRQFPASRLVSDARRGERVTYRDEVGNTITFVVEGAAPGGADREPAIRILVQYLERGGTPTPAGSARYDHLPTRHGLFPLMAPGDPDGYDRVWVWTRIQFGAVPWRGTLHPAWRFDLIDPALDPTGDGDHVVAWLDEALPVFGLVRWQRAGHTWELVSWEPR